MKLKTILFIGATAFTTQSFGQAWVEDTVTMGGGYANDVFYSLKNDEQKVESNTNWHLAFQMTPPGPYGNVSVLANHVQSGVKVYSLHMQASTNFTTLTAADTIGKTGASFELFNADSSWNYGAFNQMADASNPFDYSWGEYDMATHNVNGDSLYLVVTPSNAYKVWVKQYKSTPADTVNWQFRIAKFDNSEDTTIRIYRVPDYTDRLFAYYNIDTKTVIDREPGRSTWDIVFTRYKEYLVGAPGVPYYSVMGVLSNFDVTVAEKHTMNENDTVGFATYSYDDKMNEIGSDWKYYDMAQTPPAYVVPDTNYYFVKTNNTNEYYQLQFTGFGGSANGQVMFKKRLLGSIINSVHGINSPVLGYYLAPNPATSDVNMLIDTKEAVKGAQLIVSDMSGKVIRNLSLDLNGMGAYKMNVADMPAGVYMVTLTNGQWKASEKLIVQH